MTPPVSSEISQQITRLDDGEIVGLVAYDEANDNWQPQTIFGFPLADSMSKVAAADFLLTSGMAILAQRWEFAEQGDWFSCEFVEVHPNEVTVRITDYGHADVHQFRTLRDPLHDMRRG